MDHLYGGAETVIIHELRNEELLNLKESKKKDEEIYGRHFVRKSGKVFYSQEKKLVLNILSTGISIQTLPTRSNHIEMIKYRDIISISASPDKTGDITLTYVNRRINATPSSSSKQNSASKSTHQQTQILTFRSNDFVFFLSDYYLGFDLFCARHAILSDPSGTSSPLETIGACQILDKELHAYYEVELTCFNTYLRVCYISPKNNTHSKFTWFNHTQTSPEIHHNSQLNSSTINEPMILSSFQDNQQATPIKQQNGEMNMMIQQQNNEFSHKNNKIERTYLQNEPEEQLLLAFKDIGRIQKKLNGFTIQLTSPNLTYSFYIPDQNKVTSLVANISKRSKDLFQSNIIVTNTMQEEIHEIDQRVSSKQECELDIDFATRAYRVIAGRRGARQCILAIGKRGILEINELECTSSVMLEGKPTSNCILEGEIIQSYELKHLKDIIRCDENLNNESSMNFIKLVFSRNLVVEYMFEPFQRDHFIVEIFANITMYAETNSISRRCLDIMHSSIPCYELEINGWKYEGGVPLRDLDLDAELMSNIMSARNEETQINAVREFNVNCHLKKTTEADPSLYRFIVAITSKYLDFSMDPNLKYFIKHINIIKSIPLLNQKLKQAAQKNNKSQKTSPIQIVQTQKSPDTSRQINNLVGTQESAISTQQRVIENFDFKQSNLSSVITQENTQKNQKILGDIHGNLDDFLNNHPPDFDEDFVESFKSPSHESNLLNFQEYSTINNEDQWDYSGHITLHNKQSNNDPKSTPNVKGINKEMQRILLLCARQQFNEEEIEIMGAIRTKSVRMLGKLKKTELQGMTIDRVLELKPNTVQSYLAKIEELLKCLTIFQNCPKFFSDNTIQLEKLNEFKRILELLQHPDAMIVYQTSQLFKRIGLFHNNTMQKAETINKNFLLDVSFDILHVVSYQISNYTLVKRPLAQSRFTIRIHSCLSIINTLFQARIESTSSFHRSTIISLLQTPLFFIVLNRVLRFHSFSLLVNTLNLLNALFFFSSENKTFVNMLLMNSTILLFLMHIIIQNIYSSKQLKDIAFNLLYNLLYQRSKSQELY